MVEKTSGITTNELVIDKRFVTMLSLREKVYFCAKRFFDIAFSTFGLVLCIPIFLITSTAIYLNDFGPILYTQNRIGKNGKIFKIYKFRSMKTNSDEILKKLLKNPKIAKEWKLNHKIDNDPRITTIGKYIRRFSIDELPQLLNVLKGDMSIVGNRPYMESEKKDMGSYFDSISYTKPGITGIWQISGRNDLSFKKRLELESQYSFNCSLGLDLKIFLGTFNAIFKQSGAK